MIGLLASRLTVEEVLMELGPSPHGNVLNVELESKAGLVPLAT